jgi:hypothetical protein
LKKTIEQLWKYLKGNGVERIRYKNEEFELLLNDNSVVSLKQFLDRIARRISSKRPKKVVISRIPIRTPWGEDDVIPSRVKENMGYATHADKRFDEQCLKELGDLTLIWNDFQELFQLIRFGVEQIPPFLSMRNERKEAEDREPLRHPRLKLSPSKKEMLYQRVHDDLEELHDSGEYQNWDEVYIQLSQISKIKYRAILAGESLTPGQIKGIKVNKSRYAPKSP